MTYEQFNALTPGDFKRACGVSPETCEQMLQVLRDHEQRKVKPGRPSTLLLENQLLVALQYWREDRPYFHLGLSWGLDESVVCRTVQKMENVLSKRQAFHIPGKKPLRAGGPGSRGAPPRARPAASAAGRAPPTRRRPA